MRVEIRVNNMTSVKQVSDFTMQCFREDCRLGLCCINTELHTKSKSKKVKDIFCSRRCIQATYTVEKAKDLSLQNVRDIIPLIEYNHEHNIRSFRLSSELFPHYTNPNVEPYTLDFAKEDLARAGELANFLGHRITMHPDHYVKLGAVRQEVLEKSVADLIMHADILDMMGIPEDGPNAGILCIHGGGIYNDKEATIRRWVDAFDDLPRRVKNRICIENDEEDYSVRDCLDIAEMCSIPVILDTHHYNCYCTYHDDEIHEPLYHLVEEVVERWQSENKRPLFHISDQKVGAARGAHHDYVESIPTELLNIPELYKTAIDIDVEAKAKEQAIFKLVAKYGL